MQSGHSVILKNHDLFVKVVSSTEYDENLEDAASREASFQLRAKDILTTISTPIKVDVPRVHGVCKRVLIMENVNGVGFDRGNISTPERLASLRIAVDALVQNKIYHNDLYPDNVLWDEANQTIWITDFGMVRDTHSWAMSDQMSELI